MPDPFLQNLQFRNIGANFWQKAVAFGMMYEEVICLWKKWWRRGRKRWDLWKSEVFGH